MATHSRCRTLRSIQETTRGDQEVFTCQQLRQRSNTATFQEHLMQFRPCAQMTLGETQLDLLLRGENWDQPAKWITRISLRPRTHRTAVCKRKAPCQNSYQKVNIFVKTKNAPNDLKGKINHTFFLETGVPKRGGGGPTLGKNSQKSRFLGGGSSPKLDQCFNTNF